MTINYAPIRCFLENVDGRRDEKPTGGGGALNPNSRSMYEFAVWSSMPKIGTLWIHTQITRVIANCCELQLPLAQLAVQLVVRTGSLETQESVVG